MRRRVWSWHKDNSSVLPLKRRNDEEYERTQLLVVWTVERNNKEARWWQTGLCFSICQLLFFFFFINWTECEYWVHHWLSLSSLIFSLFPGWLEGHVMHRYPCSFLGSSFVFCLLHQLAHIIHIFIYKQILESSNGSLLCRFLRALPPI